MEAATTSTADGQCKRFKSSSFKLRSASLNSLRLRRIFDVFDRNHDNIITLDELSRALSTLGLDADLYELDTMIKSYIQPGNQGLRFEDFESLHKSINDLFFLGGLDEFKALDDLDQDQVVGHDETEEADLTEAFKVFDVDGDGYISASELQVVLGKLGFSEATEIERVKMMISSVDTNHDGRVDFFEFKDMMRTVIVRSS